MRKYVSILIVAFVLLNCDIFKSKEELLKSGKWVLVHFYDNKGNDKKLTISDSAAIFNFNMNESDYFDKNIGNQIVKNQKPEYFNWYIKSDSLIIQKNNKEKEVYQLIELNQKKLILKSMYEYDLTIETYVFKNLL